MRHSRYIIGKGEFVKYVLVQKVEDNLYNAVVFGDWRFRSYFNGITEERIAQLTNGYSVLEEVEGDLPR